jgi:hypothetical protein
MLSRRAATCVLCLVPLALSPRAWADDDPVSVEGDKFGGYVDTTVTIPGTESGTATGGGSGSAAHGEDALSCTWTEEPEFAQSLWDWMGAGEPGGRWYDVRCSDGSVYIGVYVPPASDSVPPDVALAGSLARTVVNRLQLPDPQVGQSPVGQALVGLPTWWWVEPGTWRVLRQRTSAGPVWAEVTATPVSTSWDPGDGSEPLICSGPGTAYDRSRPESVQSTDCSYTYRRSSAQQPQTGPNANNRFFTVTVTTTWQVTWRGSAGSGGQLPALTRTSSFPLAVAQRQTVVTGGSG